MENNNERQSKGLVNVIRWCKDNAGKLIGAAALGGGIAADAVRVKKHKAKIADKDGNIGEELIETLDENGNTIPEEE